METPFLIEEQSQYILENIRDIIFTLSLDGKITSLSQEFENATGWSREEWIGKHFTKIVHPDDIAIVIDGFKATIRGETLPPYEARIFTKSGNTLILEAKPTPQIVNGQMTGYLGIARDVTDRKLAEEALRASEQQYRDVITSIGDPIHVIDGDLKIIIINPSFSDWLQELNLDNKLCGKTVLEAFPFLPKNVIDEYYTVFSTGQTLVTEEVNQLNGNDYFTETRKIPITRQEEVVQVLTVVRDITEKRKTENQLRESERKFRDLVSNLTDVVLEVDSEGNFIFLSPQVTDFFGYRPEELIGKNSFEYIHPDDLENGIKLLGEALEGKHVFDFEIRIKHKKGHYVSVVASGKAIEQDGNLKFVFVLRNITKQKQMEEALQEGEERLRTFMDGATDSFSLWDSDLNIIDVNKTGLNTFLAGAKKTGIIGRHITDFHTHPDDINKYKEVLRTGIPFVADRIAPPQQYGNIDLSVKAFKVGDGLGIVATDITARKQMENALRMSEERLRSFMDAATDAFSLWDSELNLIDINQSGLKMLPEGAKKEEVIGRNIEEFVTDVTNLVPYRQVLRTGKALKADRIFNDPKYDERIVSVKAFKVGEGLGLISTDITDRKKMENNLRENEEKFRSIFENSPLGMALSNTEFRFSEVNSAFCQMLGYEEKELTQMTCYDVITEEHHKRNEKYAEKLVKGDISSYQTEEIYLKKNQETIWVRVTVSLLRDDVGEVMNFLTMVEDITASKQLEEELKKQLVKYNVKEGNLYLITEESPNISQTVVKDLIAVGYKGIVISRTPEKEYRTGMEGKYDFLWLTEKKRNEDILNFIEKTFDKSVILIDRLEYLFGKEGSENRMRFIYKLREITYLKNLIVIVSADTTSLQKHEIRILEKETHQLESRYMAKIAEEFLEILRLIYQQNNLGVRPSYSDIGEELEVSRPTVRKRIKQLLATGYLVEYKKGKSKIIEVSGKGRSLFTS